MLQRHAAGFDPRDLQAAGVKPVAGPEQLAVARGRPPVTVAPEVLAYIADLVPGHPRVTAFDVGVSPRGATALLQASRAWAWLSGRDYLPRRREGAGQAGPAAPASGFGPEAELEGVSPDGVLEAVLASVPVPR